MFTTTKIGVEKPWETVVFGLEKFGIEIDKKFTIGTTKMLEGFYKFMGSGANDIVDTLYKFNSNEKFLNINMIQH